MNAALQRNNSVSEGQREQKANRALPAFDNLDEEHANKTL